MPRAIQHFHRAVLFTSFVSTLFAVSVPAFAEEVVEGVRLCNEVNEDIRKKNIEKILEHLNQAKEVPEAHWNNCTDLMVLQGDPPAVLETLEFSLRFQVEGQPDLFYQVWDNVDKDVVLFRKIRIKEDPVPPEEPVKTEDT